MKAGVMIGWIMVFALGVGVIFWVGRSNEPDISESQNNNVSVVEGKQIIEINAIGGYTPRNTSAKADIATVIKIKTANTFDYSAAVAIPSLKYRANLPATGETLIEVPAQKSGSSLQGLCAMGMYNFNINFN